MVSLFGLDSHNYVDRELGWIDFNSRVLALSEHPDIPLAERLRFLTIVSTNFDDFFMIRAANVVGKISKGDTTKNTSGLTPQELFSEIMAKSRALIERQSEILHKQILPELASDGIHLIEFEELTTKERELVNEYFLNLVFPVLTPLVVDPSHPFPYISGLSLNLAVILKNPKTSEQFFARVKVPPLIPRLYRITREKETYFLPLENIIAHHLHELFPGVEIVDYFDFRVTRNQDIELDEDDSVDLLESIEQEILQRRFGPPVRLEVTKQSKSESIQSLVTELGMDINEVISYQGPLDYSGLAQLISATKSKRRFANFEKSMPKILADIKEESHDKIFGRIKKGEILLHHPYESFNRTVVKFLQSSAIDPHVLAIKQTLYRTSGDSPIVDALIEAAENGKQVLAVVELRARFDEIANVRWARKLESAGVHVVYGLMGLKTHAKTTLVVRQEGSELVRYCHVGTGNYNPKTADIYEDFGLLSADKQLGQDLSKIFNQLSGFVVETAFHRLLVAPRTIRSGLLEKINREIDHAKNGHDAEIKFKLNALIDEEFVSKLYEASSAGVKVNLLVRGACSVIPGIKGISENIRVRSIVGRFLEHSRIYYFANKNKPEIFIGSADLMERNLDRRVEALVKIKDNSHIDEIVDLLNEYWREDIHYFEMNNEGSWHELRENQHLLHDYLIKKMKKSR